MFVSFSDPTLASTIQKLLTKQAEKEAEALRSGNISLRIHAWQRASILLPSIFCWTSCEVAPLVSTQQRTSHEVRKTTVIYLHISTANQRTKPLKFQWFSITPTAIVGTVALYMERCIAQKGKFPTQDLQTRISFMAQSHWTLHPLYPGKLRWRADHWAGDDVYSVGAPCSLVGWGWVGHGAGLHNYAEKAFLALLPPQAEDWLTQTLLWCKGCAGSREVSAQPRSCTGKSQETEHPSTAEP